MYVEVPKDGGGKTCETPKIEHTYYICTCKYGSVHWPCPEQTGPGPRVEEPGSPDVVKLPCGDDKWASDGRMKQGSIGEGRWLKVP